MGIRFTRIVCYKIEQRASIIRCQFNDPVYSSDSEIHPAFWAVYGKRIVASVYQNEIDIEIERVVYGVRKEMDANIRMASAQSDTNDYW